MKSKRARASSRQFATVSRELMRIESAQEENRKVVEQNSKVAEMLGYEGEKLLTAAERFKTI